MWNLVEPQLLRMEPVYAEPRGTSRDQPELFYNVTVTFMWNLVEPQPLTMEPLCGTLWNLTFYEWNLYGEPRGTSRNLVPGFRRLPQATPKLYWKNPKPFRLLGKNTDFLFFSGAAKNNGKKDIELSGTSLAAASSSRMRASAASCPARASRKAA